MPLTALARASMSHAGGVGTAEAGMCLECMLAPEWLVMTNLDVDVTENHVHLSL